MLDHHLKIILLIC